MKLPKMSAAPVGKVKAAIAAATLPEDGELAAQRARNDGHTDAEVDAMNSASANAANAAGATTGPALGEGEADAAGVKSRRARTNFGPLEVGSVELGIPLPTRKQPATRKAREPAPGIDFTGLVPNSSMLVKGRSSNVIRAQLKAHRDANGGTFRVVDVADAPGHVRVFRLD